MTSKRKAQLDPFDMLAQVAAQLEGKMTDRKRENALYALDKFVQTKRFVEGDVSAHTDNCALQAFEDIMTASWETDGTNFDGFGEVYKIINTLHRERNLFDANSIIRLLSRMHARWEEGPADDIRDDDFWFPGIMMHLFAVALTLKENVDPQILYNFVWGQWLTLGKKPRSDYTAESIDLIARGLLRDMDCEEFGRRLHFSEMPRNMETVSAVKELLKKNGIWDRVDKKRECPCCGTMTNKPFER